MRRRLLVSTLAVAVAVVLVFAIPLAVVQAQSIRQEAKDSVRNEAARILNAIVQRVDRGQIVCPIFVKQLVTPGTYVKVSGPKIGPPACGAGTEPGGWIGSQMDPRRAEQLLPRVPVEVGAVVSEHGYTTTTLLGQNATRIMVAQTSGDLSREIWQAWLTIAGLGALAVAAAGGLALLQARRLSEPLVDLASTAESLGGGDLRPRARRYGVAELDQVADVLDDSAVRISRMLSAERHFAANASHQLRTPLTALSMRIEEMANATDLEAVKEEAEVALTQVERLTGVVDDLLRGSRSGSASIVMVSVDSAVQQQLEEWRPPYAHAGRQIVANGRPDLVALATPGRLAQSLAVLLENALVHGEGTVQVTSRAIGGKVIIEVTDEGSGVPAALAPRIFERRVSGQDGTGLGLALARQLVEADGGRLELTREYPAAFSIFLPRGTVAGRHRERSRAADNPTDAQPAPARKSTAKASGKPRARTARARA